MAKRTNISTTDFPTEAGVYIVWEASSDTRPLYVGVAATQTIEQRWRRQHLLNRAGGSALRRSLGTHLGLVDRKLSVSQDGRFYAPEVEQAITDHLRSCEIEFVPAASPEHARELEVQLIEELRPLLNKRRRPRVGRTLAEKTILRDAKNLYETRVKSALTSGLLAVNPTAELDPRTGYVLEVVDNLLPGVDLAALHAEFDAGAGRELESKMRAPWSSSALAVNSFAPWRDDPSELTLAGRQGFEPSFAFEMPCPNGVSAIAPHLDVVLRRPGEIVAVESKCSEYVQGSDHEVVAPAYLKLAEAADHRSSSKWFGALRIVEKFLLLDGYQLAKHYLGLRKTFEAEASRLTLVYLFWEPSEATNPGAELFERHRSEIAEFAAAVAGDDSCEFVSLSYAEHWAEQATRQEAPEWLENHRLRLQARYLRTL